MVLVTGATGLVGSHLLWELLKVEHRVVALIRYTSSLRALRAVFGSYTDTPDSYLSRVEFRVAAINDSMALDTALTGITEVFHCAAVVSLGGKDEAIRDVNVEGTRLLTELCLKHGVTAFHYVSSIAACGQYADGRPVDEQAPWAGMEQKSLYAQTKYLAEQEVWKAMKQGLKVSVVNPGVILGFSGVNSGSSMLFHQVRKGLPFYIDGGSGYVGVRDVVAALLLLRKQGIVGERFIVVAENVTNRELLSMIALGFNKRPPRIKIGIPLLVVAASILEVAGKLFRFTPPLNTTSARSSANITLYSPAALQQRTGLKFSPVSEVVKEVCKAMERSGRL